MNDTLNKKINETKQALDTARHERFGPNALPIDEVLRLQRELSALVTRRNERDRKAATISSRINAIRREMDVNPPESGVMPMLAEIRSLEAQLADTLRPEGGAR